MLLCGVSLWDHQFNQQGHMTLMPTRLTGVETMEAI